MCLSSTFNCKTVQVIENKLQYSDIISINIKKERFLLAFKCYKNKENEWVLKLTMQVCLKFAYAFLLTE